MSTKPMRLVIIESPYAGQIVENVAYARACLRHSLELGEAPIASHLLYTQEGVLRDDVPEERAAGIAAGLAWRKVADAAVFYVDRGWSSGMVKALELYGLEKFPVEFRYLDGVLEDEDEGYPPRCSNPGGHSWVVSDETDQSYCEFCCADGDA